MKYTQGVCFSPEPEASAVWSQGVAVSMEKKSGIRPEDVFSILGDPSKGGTLVVETGISQCHASEFAPTNVNMSTR